MVYSQPDYSLMRFQYEYLGYSVADLSEAHQVDEFFIERVKNKDYWCPQDLNSIFDNVDLSEEMTTITSNLLAAVKDRVTLVNLLKQHEFMERYLQLESTILAKAQMVAAAVSPSDPLGARTLKLCTDVLQQLRNYNTELLNVPNSGDEQAPSVNINLFTDEGDAPIQVN